jgi:hypothetical protein
VILEIWIPVAAAALGVPVGFAILRRIFPRTASQSDARDAAPHDLALILFAAGGYFAGFLSGFELGSVPTLAEPCGSVARGAAISGLGTPLLATLLGDRWATEFFEVIGTLVEAEARSLQRAFVASGVCGALFLLATEVARVVNQG